MTDRSTISYARYLALRSGDLIVWRGKYLRTVQKGPADDADPPHCVSVARVQFTKRARSWTKSPVTSYIYNDLRGKIRVAGKRIRTLVLKSEWLTLEALGFDVREALAGQIKEAERLHGLGWPMCKAYPRIKRLAGKVTR